MTRAAIAAVVLLLATSVPGVAAADERGSCTSSPCAQGAADSGDAGEPPHRARPDYDGRPDPGPDAVDGLLWIPRALGAPLYLVTEYLIRQPLGWLISELERSDVVDFLMGFFTLGGQENVLVLPTAFFDFGFAPSVGVYGAWRRFLHEDNRISVHAATGGEDWLLATLADHVALPDRMELRFRASLHKRPDQQVGGIGYDGTQTALARFGVETVEGSVRFGLRPWPGIELDYRVGYLGVGYVDAGWEGQPSVGDAGRALPGFATGYSSIVAHARVVIDSRTGCGTEGRTSGWDARRSIDDPGHALPTGECELSTGGLRVAVEASEHFGFGGLPDSQWLRVAGEIAAATDVLGRGRILSLRGRVQVVEALGGARIVPFTELVSLSSALRAFQPGALYGATVAALSVEYVWPIWAFLDGTLHFDVGNVFDTSFSDFDLARLRLSFGLLIAPRTGGDHLFELGVALGTETFERGADIASVRFVVGARSAL